LVATWARRTQPSASAVTSTSSSCGPPFLSPSTPFEGLAHNGWAGSAWCTRCGENAQAVDCYRRVVAFLDENPDSESTFKDSFVERIAKLAPPAAT
jgi:hypothetical protein